MAITQEVNDIAIAPASMQAAVLYGIRDLRVETVRRPEPGPGEVLLRLASVGVCGSDVHYFQDGRIGDAIMTEPLVMGHEFSAYVAQLGAGVTSLEVGQLVAVDPAIHCGECESCQKGHPNICPNVKFCGTPPTNGVYSEYGVMPAHNCFVLPEGISPVEGAIMEPLGVAIHTIDLSHIRVTDTVAVLGAGPIGLLIATVAKAAGASKIYMTEPLAYRRAFAFDYIADKVFDPLEQDVVAEIMRVTQGRGVDIAIEAAGAYDTPEQGAEMLRPGGTLVLCGIPGSEDNYTLNASVTRRKGLTIKMVRRMKHVYPRCISMVQNDMVDLTPIASHLIPLARIEEAFEMVDAYADGVIRAVIQIDS